jgi:hypothetical protein
MPLRTVALVAAVSVTIGWLLAATLTPPVARLQSLPEHQEPAAVDQPPLTRQLNRRLRDAPLPPTSGRNPFNFGGPERRKTPAREIDRPTLPDTTAVTAVPGPHYSLSGIGITGEVRSAVLTDGEKVFVVKLDEAISGYTVVEITESSVTLASDGARHTLRLAR